MPVKPDTDGYDGDCLFESLDTHYSHLAEASVLVDLRRDPRFDTRFPAEVIAENGSKTVATITNISRSGLRLEVDRQMLDALCPDYCHPTGHTTTLLRVHFSAPGGSDPHSAIKVQGRTVYIRQEKEDTWQIGMAFTGFDAGSEALTRYLLLRGNTG